jgi:cytochrome c556
MKLHMIWVATVALTMTACAEKESVNSEPAGETPMAAPDVVAPPVESESWRNDAFMKHMHLHAEKLDDLNFALADDDLEAAMTPAYWLSRHDTFEGVQQEWLPFLYGMRAEAEAVEAATDLATARAAAARINAQCQGCHVAVGVSSQ